MLRQMIAQNLCEVFLRFVQKFHAKSYKTYRRYRSELHTGMLIKKVKQVTYLSSRLFPKKAELIVVDLDLEFQVGIDQVLIILDLDWFELYMVVSSLIIGA